MTLPVDLVSFINSCVILLGSVVAVAVTAYCGFLLVRKGIGWLCMALTSSKAFDIYGKLGIW